MRAVTAVLLTLALALPALATIIEVPDDYANLQDAINASSTGDTVLVAPGSYTGPFNFNGHHITLASHYILTEDEALIEQTVLNGANAGTVLSAEFLGQTSAAVIGFLIQNGLGTGDWPNVRGGGMHVEDSSVRIAHCIFEDCVTQGSSNRGAGVYYGSEFGGEIEKCTFRNLSSYFGSAIAIANDSAGILISDCVAYDNSCTAGFVDKGAFMVTYSDDVTFERCLAYNNMESSGFRVWGSTNVLIDHCTSAGNQYLGIAAMYSGNDLTVTNSIAWGGNGYPGISQEGYANSLAAMYSDVENGTGEDWFGTGCIDADPLFADPDGGDYNLTADSPCIDAADPSGDDDPDGTPPDMGALPFFQGPPPPVTLELALQTPTIPPEGGTLLYDATLTSTLPNVIPADGWTSVILPNGQEFGPLLMTTVFVAPGEFTLFNLQQAVPAIAPGGTYQFFASIGYYPNYIGVQDSFSFTKLGDTPAGIGFDPAQWPASPWRGVDQPLAGDGAGTLAATPGEFSLGPVYPNPFNPSASVEVTLPSADEIAVTVYTVQGREAARLAQGWHEAGRHRFSFGDASWASGVYFVRITAANGPTLTRRAVLVR